MTSKRTTTTQDDDDALRDAIAVVRDCKLVSRSLLQRRLKVDYGMADRLLDGLEARGVITEADDVGRRKVIG